ANLKRAEDNEKTALVQLKQIQKQNDLLASIFSDIDPLTAEKGGPLLVEQLTRRLIVAADALEAEAIGDPLAVARMQNLLGNTLVNLRETEKAIELVKKARSTREKLLGPEHPDTLTSMNILGVAYSHAGKLEEAISLSEKTLKLRKATLGPNHP